MKSQVTQANFVKTQVKLGWLMLDVFKCQQSGHSYYSLASIVALLEKPESLAHQFLNSKTFKAKHSDSLPPISFQEGDIQLNLLPCSAFAAYLMHWALKGDPIAQIVLEALTSESLEIRVNS